MRLRAAFGVAMLAFGCSGYETEPLPLDITVQADKTETVAGDSVLFEIRAQGGALLGITIDWGDGANHTINAIGARTATSRVRHAYAQSGVYAMNATIEDASAGSKSAGISIRIR